MNKQLLLDSSVRANTKARQHNRTKKGLGLVAGALLLGMLTIGSANVSADEQTSTTAVAQQPQTTVVASSATTQAQPATTTPAPTQATSETAVTPQAPVQEAQAQTPAQAQQAQQAPAGQQPQVEVPQNITHEQAKEKIDTAQKDLKSDVSEAKEAGVKVTQEKEKEVTLNNSNVQVKTQEVLTDVANQQQTVKQATETQKANTTAYTTAVKSYDETVSAGKQQLQQADARQDEVVKQAKDSRVDYSVSNKDVTPKYISTKGLEGQALTEANNANLASYQKAVKDGVASQDKATKEAQAILGTYNKAYSDYKAGLTRNTGLKWTDKTTVEALTAQKMTGNEPAVDWGNLQTAARDAIQGLDHTQNTDAKFDNIFKINDSGSVKIKNTSNGDVTLTISNINAYNPTGTYLTVWGDDEGGIAWGVFATTQGTVGGGAGEGASGGTMGYYGNVLSVVRSYDYKGETSNAVSKVTVNDIDNDQTITVNGLDDGKIGTGKNVTANGNSFSAGSGDVSQASAGKVGSNGLEYKLGEARKVIFSGTHSTSKNNTSLVAGIFGVASEQPEAPKPVKLVLVNVDVKAPEKPEAPKQQEVKVHYYKVELTPEAPEKPETPKPTGKTPAQPTKPQQPVYQKGATLPETGDTSMVSAGYAGFMSVMTGLGLGFGKFKKKE